MIQVSEKHQLTEENAPDLPLGAPEDVNLDFLDGLSKICSFCEMFLQHICIT